MFEENIYYNNYHYRIYKIGNLKSYICTNIETCNQILSLTFEETYLFQLIYVEIIDIIQSLKLQ